MDEPKNGNQARDSHADSKRSTGLRQLARRMVQGIAILVALWAAAATTATAGEITRTGPGNGHAKARLLVQPRAGLSDHQLDLILRPHQGRRIEHLAGINMHVIELPAGVDEQGIARLLKGHRHLKFVELDHARAPDFTPNDPSYASEWHLPKINAPSAWNLSTGSGVIIAILDSGVDATHPDLAANMVAGWNFFDNDGNTADVFGHGTKVAGSAAASGNNGVGVAGVAWQSKIMPLRVTDTAGYAYDSYLAAAITWAADHGARVANISFLGVTESAAVVSAANYMRSKGGIVVAAAGNTGALESSPATNAITSVAATDSTDARTGWSSYGNYVDVAAPGAGIYTTASGGGYASVSGTSFSSPITAGVYALMISANPNSTPANLDSALFNTALDKGTAGWDTYFGWGRVDAYAAVSKVKGSTPTDTQAPSVAITSPVSGAVQGLVPVNVSASDNVGVTRVELWVNGALYATDPSSPYAFSWDTGSLVSGTYTLKAIAYDAAGNQSTSASVSLQVTNASTTAPSAPTGLTASDGTSSSSVTVTWLASGNATGYTVYRSSLAGTLGSAIGNTTGALSHVDSAVVSGTRYYYCVVATNGAGSSPASNQDSGYAGSLASGGTTGLLSGSGVASSATVNLTTMGTSDWAKWPNYLHKISGGGKIGNYISIGSGTVSSYGNDARTVSWSDGTPTVSGSNQAGLFVLGLGNGFKLTVPADTTTRTLTLYVGGWNSTGKLVAHLSDGSAVDYVNSSFSGTAKYDVVYTITFRAASAAQQLSVTWTVGSGTGNVLLQGAALQ